MLQANELRLGNWVKCRGFKPMRVYYRLLFDVMQQPQSYSGIPLTPEILEKVGFEKVNNIYRLRIDEYKSIFHDGKGNNITLSVGHEKVDFVQEIEVPGGYVHQLQNLYFALTGTELNIEL